MSGENDSRDTSIIEVNSDNYDSFFVLREELVREHKDSKIPQTLIFPSYLVLVAVDGAIGKYQMENGIIDDKEVNQDGMIKINDNGTYDSFLDLRDKLVEQHKSSKIPQTLISPSFSVLDAIDGAINKYQEQIMNNDESINKESSGTRK